MRGWYRFQFKSEDEFEDGRLTLQLAIMSAEGLFGEVRVRLELASAYDTQAHAIDIDGSNLVGETLIRILTRLLTREFGEHGFAVEKLAVPPLAVAAEATGADSTLPLP